MEAIVATVGKDTEVAPTSDKITGSVLYTYNFESTDLVRFLVVTVLGLISFTLHLKVGSNTVSSTGL